jgi:hypothetical protein
MSQHDPWEGVKSPFDADVIGPGDPGWEVFKLAMRTGKPVIGEYDGDTGEVISARTVGDDDDPVVEPPAPHRSWLGRLFGWSS